MKTFFETLFGLEKKEKQEDKLFLIETSKIIGKEETKSGLITKLITKDNEKFAEISIVSKPEIVSVKKGIVNVEQSLKITYNNPGTFLQRLKNCMETNTKVSVLHISPAKHSYLYGENIGMNVIEVSETNIILAGVEADAFYEVEFEHSGNIVALA